MLRQILSRLSPERKSRLRAFYYSLRKQAISTFRSYDNAGLVQALRSLGLTSGDTLMVHGGFLGESGYRGSPSMVVDALLEVLGPNGNLTMVSMAYLSSAYDYLKEGKPFDVRKTPSYMGMVSESFRRHPGVRRSLNPVHPVLAFGPKAAWLVEGHESCQYPCGHGSPFAKLAELHAKFLFYDASLHTLTFFHYLEHLVQDRLDFPIYHHELLQTQVIDAEGQARALQSYVYAPAAIARRNPDKMHEFLERKGQIPSVRVGNSRLQLMHADDLVQVVADMAAQGVVFYD